MELRLSIWAVRYCYYMAGKVPLSTIIICEGQSADNFPHVALEGVLKISGNILGALVQKVLSRQLDPLRIGRNADLCHRIHIDIDEAAAAITGQCQSICIML